MTKRTGKKKKAHTDNGTPLSKPSLSFLEPVPPPAPRGKSLLLIIGTNVFQVNVTDMYFSTPMQDFVEKTPSIRSEQAKTLGIKLKNVDYNSFVFYPPVEAPQVSA